MALFCAIPHPLPGQQIIV